MHYIKTTSGIQALQSRDKQLNAKQRQLLFLLGTPDFEKLSPDLKQRICTPQLIESLMLLGFITSCNTTQSPALADQIQTSSQTTITPFEPATPPSTDIIQNQVKSDEQNINMLELSLNNMQKMMVDSLQQYAGLLAKTLIGHIEQCQNHIELKKHQMQWLTILQETRLPAQQLHFQMKQLQLYFTQQNRLEPSH